MQIFLEAIQFHVLVSVVLTGIEQNLSCHAAASSGAD